jgi:hypothetical protein
MPHAVGIGDGRAHCDQDDPLARHVDPSVHERLYPAALVFEIRRRSLTLEV